MNIENTEIILVLVIVGIQLLIFRATNRQIRVFKRIIPDISLLKVSKIYLTFEELKTKEPKRILEKSSTLQDIRRVEQVGPDGFIEITIIESSENANAVFEKILYSVNTYLLRNQGASSDFNLIKDITERNTDAVEDDINLTVSIPLYLGLMGTMLGIVIGLFSMSDLSQTFIGASGDDAVGQGISVLLSGVKIAMIASFSGLLLTTINSGWFFKGSKSRVEENKNQFYTFIQTELLPVINQSLNATLESLQRNLLKFNGEFSSNLNKLSGVFDKNSETLTLQKEILSAIENINIATIAKYNVNVLKELQVSINEFEKFNTHATNINTSLDNSKMLVEGINNLLARTDNFKKIADNLDDKLTQSRLLIEFLSKHFQNLEAYKQHTNDSISEVSTSISNTFSALIEHIHASSRSVREFSVEETELLKKALSESKQQATSKVSDVGFSISETFEELKKHIQESSQSVKNFTVDEVELLKKALSESRTNLGNLQFLESLNGGVIEFKENATSQADGIKKLLEELNSKLSKSINTLESIERRTIQPREKGLMDYLRGLFSSNGNKL